MKELSGITTAMILGLLVLVPFFKAGLIVIPLMILCFIGILIYCAYIIHKDQKQQKSKK